MRSARTATITCGLALWVMLALAPMVGACMDGSCEVEMGVRTAHCGSPATTMLCCEETDGQPVGASVPSHRLAVEAVLAPYEAAAGPFERNTERLSAIAQTSHGPPLYELFASLLI